MVALSMKEDILLGTYGMIFAILMHARMMHGMTKMTLLEGK